MKALLPYIFLLVFFTILTTSVIFLSRRFTWILSMESTTFFYVGFSVIILFFLMATGVFINSTTGIGHILFKMATVTMGVYLFLVLSFLLVDLANIFLKLSPVNYGVIGLGLTLFITLFGYWNSYHVRTTSVEIPMPGLNKTMKAVHLTDIHIGHFRNNGYLEDLIQKTNDLNPEIIFLTGDYLDSRYALTEKYFEPLRKLNAPVYFVDGNHDLSTDRENILTNLRNVGVNVLENELASFENLQIVGLNHMLADRNSFDLHASEDSPTIDETLPKISMDKTKPTVLLHHAPNGIKYAHREGVDLYLAGHTHGGQIFPFNLITNLVFEYNRGLHTYKNMHLLVSEGVGTFGPPFRIGTKSEIIALSLVPE